MDTITFTLNNNTYKTTRETLSKSKLFNEIEHNTIDIYSMFGTIISNEAFENILEHLRGDNLQDQYMNEKIILIDGDKIIKLDIGGKHFDIAESILMKSKFFEALISSYDGTERIFIDRNPKKFNEILKYLINDKCIINPDCHQDLDYYNIQYSQNILKYKTTTLSSPGTDTSIPISPMSIL
jgi:hypothetical protein